MSDEKLNIDQNDDQEENLEENLENNLEEKQEDNQELIDFYRDDPQFQSLMKILRGTEGSFALNRIVMQKIIDSSWVEAIEKGLLHVDNVLRNPRRTIEDVEEIVPIALSRKITVESVKHLAQHTDLIQSIDKKTGKITPSKILNVHKEESLMTYENKFVNTLIDRLYIFITMRYEKLAKVAKDEEVFTLGFNTSIEDGSGGKMKIEIHIENEHSLEARDHSGYTIWQRVEKLKKAIEGYKGSELCKTLGNTFIRPPVMRTNAIMKNVDLKACLTLWQYIESYDKVGYEINIEDSAVQPEENFIDDFYELIGLHLMLFRTSVSPDQELMEVRQLEPVAPKIVKLFEDVSARFDSTSKGGSGYISQTGDMQLKQSVPENAEEILQQIELAIQIEHNYQEELRAKELEEQRLAEEMERRRLEEERIEAERQAELARLEAEKAEQERLIQEMLEQKRREQEEEERERERMEQERLRLLEEKRRKEEEEKARLEEERKQREAEEAKERERIRIAEEKKRVRSELSNASDIKAKESPPENVAAAKKLPEEESPAEVAARMKREQQQREKERAETERAQRLKAERKYFESKPFEQIRREYSKNPFRMLIRLIRYILAMVFGIIPEDTDRPDFKERRQQILQKREQIQKEKEERTKMEVYYKKYAQTFKYRTMRSIQDRKFQRKRKLERKNKPRPVYKSKYTPEQQAEIQKEMRALYREYHVSVFEHIRRWFKSEINRYKTWRKEIDSSDIKLYKRVLNGLLITIVGFSVCFSIYVTACAIMGNPVDIFGYNILRVETGSMEPALHVGDYIVVKKCDPAALKKDDIISFYSEQEDIKGKLVTHRIAWIGRDGTFITRGDANPVNDPVPVKPSSVFGTYVRKSGFYMFLGSFADTHKLFLLLVMIPLTLISLYELRSMIKIGKKAREESSEEAENEAKEKYEKRMREAIEAEKKRLAEENYQPVDDQEDTDEQAEMNDEQSDEDEQISQSDTDDEEDQINRSYLEDQEKHTIEIELADDYEPINEAYRNHVTEIGLAEDGDPINNTYNTVEEEHIIKIELNDVSSDGGTEIIPTDKEVEDK